MRLLDRFRGCGCRQRVGPRQKTAITTSQNVAAAAAFNPACRRVGVLRLAMSHRTMPLTIFTRFDDDGVPCMANRRASARMSCDVEVTQLKHK
jgi:hypothetical protein